AVSSGDACFQELPERSFSVPSPEPGALVSAIYVSASLPDLLTGEIDSAFSLFDSQSIALFRTGATQEMAVTLDARIELTPGPSCSLNSPFERAEVGCLLLADLSAGRADPRDAPPEGDLAVIGVSFTDTQEGPAEIGPLSTARFPEQLGPGRAVAVGTASAAGLSGPLEDAQLLSVRRFDDLSVDSLAFDRFLAVYDVECSERTAEFSALTEADIEAHYQELEVLRVIEEQQSLCRPDDWADRESQPLWRVVLPAAVERFTFPDIPPDWPRGSIGSPGFFDVRGSPESDDLVWRHQAVREGDHPSGFDFNRRRFEDGRRHGTEFSSNRDGW
ncbi:MAG: hypothetical protein AAFQ82_26035, partial [Myxococcota bacterium]